MHARPYLSDVLFVLKHRIAAWTQGDYYSGSGKPSGLYNSAMYVNNMLNDYGMKSSLVHVVDANAIDREVSLARPAYVILEAVWVTPQKVRELVAKHPAVKWIVRNHSDWPFLCESGITLQWMLEYIQIDNVWVACNLASTWNDMTRVVQLMNLSSPSKTLYLPNYYQLDYVPRESDGDRRTLNVGCFGAIRPLKNQLTQAIAAVMAATTLGQKLRFHINGTRVEQGGNPALRSIQSLFASLPQHELVCHEWMQREEFLTLYATMDVGMQVSFSETCNLVAADATNVGVPLVVSSQIFWVSENAWANPNSADDIADKIVDVLRFPHQNVRVNRRGLEKYAEQSKNIWLTSLGAREEEDVRGHRRWLRWLRKLFNLRGDED